MNSWVNFFMVVLTLGNILACLWLMWWTAKRRPATAGDKTAHVWDGIEEYNNPMPRWWVYTFYATIVWAVGYMIVYPAVPLLTDATKGVLGYSSRAEVSAELASAKAAQAGNLEKIASSSIAACAS